MIRASAKTALERAAADGEKRLLNCDPTTYHYLVDSLDRVKEQTGKSLEPLHRRTDAVGKYTIPEKTYEALCSEVGVDYVRPQ